GRDIRSREGLDFAAVYEQDDGARMGIARRVVVLVSDIEGKPVIEAAAGGGALLHPIGEPLVSFAGKVERLVSALRVEVERAAAAIALRIIGSELQDDRYTGSAAFADNRPTRDVARPAGITGL